VDVEPTHNNDSEVLIPAIESIEQQDLKAKELTADSLYGSSDNCEQTKKDKKLFDLLYYTPLACQAFCFVYHMVN
jgi:hypothetical protein